jgi:hypothetical protein
MFAKFVNTKGVVICLAAALAVLAVIGAQSSTAEPNAVAKVEPKAGPSAGPYEGKIDPVKENGAIFVGWPKPDVALVFSGEQDGYLEPCGCAGLENQKGGLQRRFTLFQELRDKGWPVIAMDSGGQEKRTGKQAELKLDFSYRALEKLKYAAVGIGPEDLRLDLFSVVINLPDPSEQFVSANVGIGDFESGFTKRYKVVEAGGMKIGITTVLGKKELAGFKNAGDFTFMEPEKALAEVVPEMRRAGCDQMVLLAHAEPAEAKELARQFPDFNWVSTAHGADEPPKEPMPIEGAKAQLIEVGHKGMYVVVIGLYKNGAPPFRYQRVPLDHRFTDAPEIHRMHVEYQTQLERLGLVELGLKPSPHPSGRKFAGSKACADCHTNATDVFEKTPHIHATETLVKLDPPRQFDPECLSCHATGWHPQEYFPYESGFTGLKETPDLVGNGCENCHGPAAEHVAAESGESDATDAEIEQLREALRLKIVDNEGNKKGQVYKERGVVDMCMQCHDLDNSPDFDFQVYWPKVKHEGKD